MYNLTVEERDLGRAHRLTVLCLDGFDESLRAQFIESCRSGTRIELDLKARLLQCGIIRDLQHPRFQHDLNILLAAHRVQQVGSRLVHFRRGPNDQRQRLFMRLDRTGATVRRPVLWLNGRRDVIDQLQPVGRTGSRPIPRLTRDRHDKIGDGISLDDQWLINRVAGSTRQSLEPSNLFQQSGDLGVNVAGLTDDQTACRFEMPHRSLATDNVPAVR
jgi:hypothetical protein